MGRDFESSDEQEFDADVETVWQAIATGPGLDGWFIGSTTIEPRVGGDVTTRMGPVVMNSTVTAWDPPRHFAFRGGEDAEGRFQAYEFLIEGRDHGSAVLRLISSGFLPGDDWEDELEAMSRGGEMFFATLIAYVNHFAGRAGTPVDASGPPVGDWATAFAALYRHLGLGPTPAVGDTATIADPTRGDLAAVVAFVSPHALALRESDAMYRFVRGFHSGGITAMHNVFLRAIDTASASLGWREWLRRLYT